MADMTSNSDQNSDPSVRRLENRTSPCGLDSTEEGQERRVIVLFYSLPGQVSSASAANFCNEQVSHPLKRNKIILGNAVL